MSYFFSRLRFNWFTFLFFVVLIFISCISNAIFLGDENPTVVVRKKYFKNLKNIFLVNGEHILGEFKSNYDNLGIVSVKFNTDKANSDDKIIFRLKEKNGVDWIYSNEYEVKKIINDHFFPFGFPKIEDSKGKEYLFEIFSVKNTGNSYLTVDSSFFLIKNDFSKEWLKNHPNKILFFVFNKFFSFFLNIEISSYLLIGISFFLLKIIINFILDFIFCDNFKKIIRKKYFFETFFVLISFIFFIFLSFNPQDVIWDAAGYLELGNKIYKNGFNLFLVNLENRTYVFPFYLSILYGISDFLKIPINIIIFIGNYIAYIISILLINKVLKKISLNVGKIFLILSSFNLINLSFLNVVLTEPIMILFCCGIFYILNRDLKHKYNLLLLGLFVGLSVLLRPSNLILFIVVTIFVFFVLNKKIILTTFYILPILFLFGVSFLISYKVDNSISLFTGGVNGIYDMQVREGIKNFKYETNVDEDYSNDSTHYYDNLYTNKLSEVKDCDKSLECALSYFFKSPLDYSRSLLIHTFTLFDRNYMDTYIKDVDKINRFIVIYNYVVLSSTIIFIIFFYKKLNLQEKKVIKNCFLIIFSSLVVYLPTVVEPRFSSPVFPLLLVITSFYLEKLFRVKKCLMWRFVSLQIIFMILFSIISYVIRQSVSLKML